ncbi:GNAT family N-acetyltransferase [Sphingomonas xinjiangensis]|uniref:Ribosomal protein S18 acetylase RimI-like enzyme n=1 Tax=Sphingomonas xinjiangensis TaxID=643568 RepID=A0A840YMX5_9SPHN|nr:GNAT family N-acetyltransferase [Sphingomonas xinjiangensis]MBB5711366.1 ribosomal protein S18 acetylase RimI-like enzyme [Sphingomonas xinjiangensis]
MIRYRDASAADLPAIDAIFRTSFVATFGSLYKPDDLAAFLGGFTPEAWAAELARPGMAARLAEDEAGAIGFCKIGPVSLPVEPGPPTIELRQLYLLERGQGTGAAQALMDWAIGKARTQGGARLVLSVYVDNHRARRFYERHGFVEIGRYEFRVGNHIDDDRLMSLTL